MTSPLTPKSWKPQVIADETGKWLDNALRFATYEEAFANAEDLMMRWFAVRDHRAVPSDDPVNYRLDNGKLVSIAAVTGEKGE